MAFLVKEVESNSRRLFENELELPKAAITSLKLKFANYAGKILAGIIALIFINLLN